MDRIKEGTTTEETSDNNSSVVSSLPVYLTLTAGQSSPLSHTTQQLPDSPSIALDEWVYVSNHTSNQTTTTSCSTGGGSGRTNIIMTTDDSSDHVRRSINYLI